MASSGRQRTDVVVSTRHGGDGGLARGGVRRRRARVVRGIDGGAGEIDAKGGGEGAFARVARWVRARWVGRGWGHRVGVRAGGCGGEVGAFIDHRRTAAVKRRDEAAARRKTTMDSGGCDALLWYSL